MDSIVAVPGKLKLKKGLVGVTKKKSSKPLDKEKTLTNVSKALSDDVSVSKTKKVQ